MKHATRRFAPLLSLALLTGACGSSGGGKGGHKSGDLGTQGAPGSATRSSYCAKLWDYLLGIPFERMAYKQSVTAKDGSLLRSSTVTTEDTVNGDAYTEKVTRTEDAKTPEVTAYTLTKSEFVDSCKTMSASDKRGNKETGDEAGDNVKTTEERDGVSVTVPAGTFDTHYSKDVFKSGMTVERYTGTVKGAPIEVKAVTTSDDEINTKELVELKTK